MKLKQIANNMTVLSLEDNSDTQILFSYETPVAVSALTSDGRERYKTSTYYSRTTTKHINKWFQEYDGEIEQSLLNDLTNGKATLIVQTDSSFYKK